jgi:hypothetical protein
MTDHKTDAAQSNGEPDVADARLAEPGAEKVQPESSDVAEEGAGNASADHSEEDVTAEHRAADATAVPKQPRIRRSISLSVRSLILGVVVTLLIGAAGTLGWLYAGARAQLDAQSREQADDTRAEKIALDYAVNAATMDYKDLQAWKVKLVAGTSPELNAKLSEAAGSMEQILDPLQWISTGEPLVAKVRSKTAGTIVVDSFVSVQTKTIQAPEPLQSTATYAVTIDTNNNWLITDVGGIGSVVGPK